MVVARDEIDAFVKSLQESPRGRIVAANILGSVQAGLVSADVLAVFLRECVATIAGRAMSSLDALIAVDDVSAGRGAGRRSYLRQSRQDAATLRGRVSNTMRTETFYRFLLAPSYKVGGGLPVVLPLTPANSPSAVAEYRQRLITITSADDWIAPDAVLGRPLPIPSNCWVTSDEFIGDPDAPSYAGDDATQVRDELGLIDCRDGFALIRLTFDATSISARSTHELARPTFMDGGNSRFHVNQGSGRANEFGTAGWGATVHLAKVGNAAFSDTTGVHERVSEAIPVAVLDGLNPDFLGHTSGTRGVTSAKDDDDAFALQLESGREPEYIRAQILSFIP